MLSACSVSGKSRPISAEEKACKKSENGGGRAKAEAGTKEEMEPKMGTEMESRLRTDEKPDMPSRGRRSENNPDEVLPAFGCQCIRRRGRRRVGKTTARCAADLLPQVEITAGVRHGVGTGKTEVG